MNAIGNLSANWQKVGGAAGILFVVLFVIGISLQLDSPSHTDSIGDIREWYADNGERYIIGDYIIGLAMVLLFLPFLGALRNMLVKAEQGEARLASVAYAGGLLIFIAGGVISLFAGAVAYGLGVADGLDESTVLTALYLEFYGFVWLLPLGGLAFVLAASLVIWQTSVIWRWLAVLGLIVAALGAIAPLGLLDADPEGLGAISFTWFIGWGVWVLLVGVAMLTKQESSSGA